MEVEDRWKCQVEEGSKYGGSLGPSTTTSQYFHTVAR